MFFVTESQIVILRRPSHSSDLNPIQNLKKEGKNKVMVKKTSRFIRGKGLKFRWRKNWSEIMRRVLFFILIIGSE